MTNSEVRVDVAPSNFANLHNNGGNGAEAQVDGNGNGNSGPKPHVYYFVAGLVETASLGEPSGVPAGELDGDRELTLREAIMDRENQLGGYAVLTEIIGTDLTEVHVARELSPAERAAIKPGEVRYVPMYQLVHPGLNGES